MSQKGMKSKSAAAPSAGSSKQVAVVISDSESSDDDSDSDDVPLSQRITKSNQSAQKSAPSHAAGQAQPKKKSNASPKPKKVRLVYAVRIG
jgi:hypothetical protein